MDVGPTRNGGHEENGGGGSDGGEGRVTWDPNLGLESPSPLLLLGLKKLTPGSSQP